MWVSTAWGRRLVQATLAVPLICLFLVLADAAAPSQALLGSTVAGIDLGSQFVRVSYVAPGGSNVFPIMLNDMSDRSTVNAVAFRNGKPFLGPHAVKPILNQPERGYLWLNSLLGRQFEDAAVADTLAETTAEFVRDPERGTVAAKTVGEEVAPVEYLAAMLLSKLIEQTEADSRKLITEVVITVPPYFGQAQRQAVLDAAKIAGISVLSLTSDVSAAALYYGTFSSTKNTERRHVVLIDSGATHTTAALIYVDPNHVEEKKTAILVEVKRTATDTRLHGLALDRAVAKILTRKFEAAHKGAKVTKGRVYNRLMVEASKVKRVLSANTEIRVNIEELVGDNHLSASISREELEAECASLKTIASGLINQLLEESGMKLEDIHHIIPIGGNSYVPLVQEDLRGAFGEKVQGVLNKEETTVQGAAWYAASLARFRVKATRFRDSYPYSVSLSYTSSPASAAKPSVVPIYPAHSFVDGHKRVKFRDMESIDCVVSVEGQGDVAEAKIEGVSDALATAKDKKITSNKLKFWVDLTSSGMVEVKDKPVVDVEYEVEETRTIAPTPTPTATATATDSSAATASDAAAAAPAAAEPKVETVTVVKTESLPLRCSIKRLHGGLSPEEVATWRSAINKIKEAERAMIRRGAARNALEARMYYLKDQLDQDDFVAASKEAERALISEVLEKVAVILDDETGHTTEDYEKMLNDLLEAEQPIELRMSEHQRRPAAIEKLREHMRTVTDYVARTRRDYPDPASRAQTDHELEELQKNVGTLSKWIADVEAQQAKQGLTADPAVLCSVFEDRAAELHRTWTVISAKKLPPPPPAPATTPSAEDATNETATAAQPTEEAKEETGEKMEL